MQTRDFLSAIITHSISAVVRAACLRTGRPWPDIIFEIYAIGNARLEDSRRALSYGERHGIVLLSTLARLNWVFEMLLHQHLMTFWIAERLKWPKKLNEKRKKTKRERKISLANLIIESWKRLNDVQKWCRVLGWLDNDFILNELLLSFISIKFVLNKFLESGGKNLWKKCSTCEGLVFFLKIVLTVSWIEKI